MRKHWWLVLGVVALAGSGSLVQAQEIRHQMTPRPAPPAPVVGAAWRQLTADEPPVATPMAASSCPTCATCDSRGEFKLRRLFDWLFYRPQPTKIKSCEPCVPCCPPPLYAFFPCRPGCGHCGGCGTGAVSPALVATPAPAPAPTSAPATPPAQEPVTLYYTKAAEVPVPELPVQAASHESQPPAAAPQGIAAKPAAPDPRPTTYQPGKIAKTMPVLPPSLFRSPPAPCGNPNACPPPPK